ncbi:GTP-binding protein [Jiella sp. MQZ9-1]|uniref:GTP-binding protein n=1 Tax=Jiella flava TaxID=2816857 RepID=A0A939G153_9HYPH|nr:GTP-binding protein [Jiella flava]MBO0663643.1 GTP-binding protein [Jiella flava]MCD2472218.1 GTP-binding protein [Jiella flava]
MAPQSISAAPIRLTLLTGFLGAGKTTLLNRLIGDPALSGAAVVVNEFGEAAIDPILVEAVSSDGVISLSNGCLCCTVRGELIDTLCDLAEAKNGEGGAPLQRVVVETTGLADPGPILSALMSHPTLVEAYTLDGVVTVVDGAHGAKTLDDHADSRRQVAVADRIVLTKGDLASPAALQATRTAIRDLNARAPIVDASTITGAEGILVGCGLTATLARGDDIGVWLGEPSDQPDAHCDHEHDHYYHHDGDHSHGHHDHEHHLRQDGIRSFSLETDRPVTWLAITGFLEILNGTAGQKILRMKGIVRLAEDPDRPLVLHGVQGFLHPPARLAAWPAGAGGKTRLVVIAQDLEESFVRDLFAAFTGGVAPDTADRTAIEENPLAIPGLRFGP